MSEDGEIRKLEVNGEYRFDGFNHEHQHLICMRCGKVEDIQLNISNSIITKAKKDGYNVTSTTVLLNGTCLKCKK